MIGDLNAFIPAYIRIFINHTLYDKTLFLHVQLRGPDGYLQNPSGNTYSEKLNEFGIRHTMLINALFI